MTTNVFEPLLANRVGDTVVSPAKVPVRGYVPWPSAGVTEHEAVPVLLVIPVQVSLPLSLKVTGSLAMAADVAELVSTPDTCVATLY